jgi:hypothetical protein
MDRPPRARRLWLLAPLFALAFGSLPAAAATVSAVSITLNPTNSANFFDDAGATASVVTRAASVLSSSAVSFSTRYALVVGADTGGGGGGDFTQTFTANFTISFQVTAGAGVAWDVNFTIGRVGAMTIVDDGSGDATVTLGAMTGVQAGAGSLSSGSLGLGGLSVTNAGAGTTSPNSAFNQSTTATISGVGTGAGQLVTLTFAFNASALTNDPPGGGVQGDEAALRMGFDSALSSFTADDYPGPGGRTLAGDGIFVSATAVPEPDTALLISFGLGGLAVIGRERRSRQPV